VKIATEDVTWHERTIRRGDMVVPLMSSANRDPRQFPDPDRLRPAPPDGTARRLRGRDALLSRRVARAARGAHRARDGAAPDCRT
jgi:cytochrome P450 PksS